MSSPRRANIALRRLLDAENRVFGWAAEAEYRLGLAPRGTKLVPTKLHRWMLRFLVASLTLFVVVFAVAPRATRAGWMLAALGLVISGALAVLLIDAWSGPRRR